MKHYKNTFDTSQKRTKRDIDRHIHIGFILSTLFHLYPKFASSSDHPVQNSVLNTYTIIL